MKKEFVTLKPFPGGIKTGTHVIFMVDSWIFIDNTRNPIGTCPYNPENYVDFFGVVITPKYKKDQSVYLTEKYTQNKKNLSYRVPVIITYVPTTLYNKIRYEVEYAKQRFTVNETDIIIPDFYYFISSTGTIHSEIKNDKHKDSFVFKYRVASKNYFESKELANRFLANIKLEIFKKGYND